MKTTQSLILVLFINCSLSSQNLVPNPSFEEYSACPTNTVFPPVIELALGWSRYSGDNPTSSPDYYNACAPSYEWGVPQSFFIYQQDNRNCNAYMGLITWETYPNYREHIGIELNQPLVIGQKYFVSFYTVAGGSNFDGSYLEAPSNNVGLRLSTVAYNSSNPVPIDNFAHLRSVAVINDTANWVRISGSIVADSSYSYVMLGNFFDDANTDTLMQTCGTCTNNYSYYLVDDICVSTDSLLCNSDAGFLPCVVSVEEDSLKTQFSLFPNPTHDFITIKNHDFQGAFDLAIYNTLGQKLYSEQNIIADNLQIDVGNHISGILIITITSNKNQLNYKLLKQ
jgi:hypothetical protein